MKTCSTCKVEKTDSEFGPRSLKCRSCRNAAHKIYSKSEAGKLVAKRGREKHKEKLKEQSKLRVKKNTQEITDRYVIEALLNVRTNKGKYTLSYLKQHPEIIEKKRVDILKHRIIFLIKKAEDVSNIGICTKCKKTVPFSEFRFQKKTEKKRAHYQRICNSCKKEYSKQYWQKSKNKK